MKILHRLATNLGLISYTLEDIIEKAQKTNEKEVTITAIMEKYSDIGEGYCPGKYQPVAIIGKKFLNVGKPVHVNFEQADQGFADLRDKAIQERQAEVEETFHYYVEKLHDSGIRVGYCNFNRSY